MSDNSTFLLGAKFERRDVKLIQDACKIRGEDVSSFLRRATKREMARLGLLTDEEVRILGITTEQSP